VNTYIHYTGGMFVGCTLDRRCNTLGFHGGDSEECRLVGYKNTVHPSQDTYYVSATDPRLLVKCNEGFTAVTMNN
jgi:hypothetical protein